MKQFNISLNHQSVEIHSDDIHVITEIVIDETNNFVYPSRTVTTMDTRYADFYCEITEAIAKVVAKHLYTINI